MTFEEARAQFPVLEKVAYLQAGSAGPLARSTFDAMQAEEERDLVEGRSGLEYIDRILALRAAVRARLAELVGVEAEQVALTGSTTDGCNVVLAGFGLGPGDEVVTTTDEHFGLIGPLHTSGARVVVAPPDPDAIVAAVTPRTRLLALSQALWTTGQVLPVHELRERTGLPILVDAAQSVGAIPVEAAGLDFFTISGQKWLCGPESTGALVVADPERLRVARPSYFSQQSYEPDGSFVPWPGARRFDPCWVPLASMSGLLAALDARPEWGFERASEMAERCRALLLEAGEDVVVPEQRATLVSWRPAGEEPAAVVRRLADAGVVVRDIPKTGLVRASIGWWTSDDDLDRLVRRLESPFEGKTPQMSEPGLDLHEWASVWASIEEDEALDPEDALSQYADLVEHMLTSRGYRVTDPVERTGDEPELVVTYRAARDVAERAEVGQASRAEVLTAIGDLRSVFDTIVEERP